MAVGASWLRDGCPARRAQFVGPRCGLLRARTLLLVQPYGTIYLPAKKFHRGGRSEMADHSPAFVDASRSLACARRSVNMRADHC